MTTNNTTMPSVEEFDAALRASAEAFNKSLPNRYELAARVNELRERALNAFAESRGLKYAPDLSAHHRDAFVPRDKRPVRANVTLLALHGHFWKSADGQQLGMRPEAANGERLPWSWCHGSLGWAVAVKVTP